MASLATLRLAPLALAALMLLSALYALVTWLTRGETSGQFFWVEIHIRFMEHAY